MKKNKYFLSLILCLIFVFCLFAEPVKAVYAENTKSIHTKTQSYTDPQNDYMSIIVSNDKNTTGRFAAGATGNITGKSFQMLYGWPGEVWSSFTTIKVDDKDYIFGQPDEGTLVKAPTDGDNLTNETVWKIGSIEITQDIQIIYNPSTGLRDTGMYKYIIKNTDTVPHNAGTRILLDTELDTYDGSQIEIPQIGRITNEMSFTGNSIPKYYKLSSSTGDPGIASYGTLTGFEAVKPDKFAVCNWEPLYGTMWDYDTSQNKPLEDDRSVGIWWNPTTIQPGDSKEYNTYYGLGIVTDGPKLSITGPSELQVKDNAWSPNPFTLSASILNNSDSPFENIPLDLLLPEGLVLASPADSLNRTIPIIEPGKTGEVSWEVRAIKAGAWDYTVNAFAGSDIRQTDKATVLVPVLGITPDTTPPATSHTSNPLPNSSGWNNSDVKVGLTSWDNDGGSGVDKIFYDIIYNGQTQNKEFEGSHVDYTVSSEGITRINYRALDKAGNLESPKAVEYKIDKTKPEVAINIPKNQYNKAEDTLEINFNAVDKLSGLDSVEAYLGSMKVENGQKLQLLKYNFSGNQQLKVTAKDKAGNITVKTFDVFIKDTTPALPETGSSSGLLEPLGIISALIGMILSFAPEAKRK